MGEKIEVVSSNIQAVKHNDTDNTLDVWFKNNNNSFYRYSNIDFILYSEFMTAESKGKYFAEKIKPLPFEKIENE